MAEYFLGIDVGTGSARAGVFDADGNLLGSAKRDIQVWREAGDIVEQSSEDIWQAVCDSVRRAVAESGIDPASVAGVGYDATCSLVVVGEGGRPLTVSPAGDAERNVIVWMDHRAMDQARRINQSGARVLDYVGGTISPEMETPKLLWLAEHMPETFRSAWQFFDLADFLTWRSTGSLSRSVCTVTCKWTYLAHESRWDADYFRTVGLGVLADEDFRRIGTDIVPAGTPLQHGLTVEAAAALGLKPGTPVGAGLIDAHAGGIGTVGARGDCGTVLTRMAYVFGTSACTMTTTAAPVFVPGVWGPYYQAMVPGLWLNEGGQSAAGAAIDHLVRMHPASAEAATIAGDAGMSLSGWLSHAAEARGGAAATRAIVGELHVVPEFLGNRAPFADPDARALVAGIGMETDIDSLVALYVAGVCGLGYGARQIVRALQEKGIPTDTIVVSGGAGQSPLVRQLLADTTGLTVAASISPEPVLLGSAMVGALAAGKFPAAAAAMPAMSRLGETHVPQSDLLPWHELRFQAFEDLQATSRRIRRSFS